MALLFKTAFAALIWLLTLVVSIGSPLDDAAAYWRRGDFQAAMSIWTHLAKDGDTFAQVTLYMIYDHGEPSAIKRNPDAALYWLRHAVDAGDARAMWLLGNRYLLDDEGGDKSLAEALRWYHRADDLGFTTAVYSLESLYSGENGVVPSEALHAEYFQNRDAAKAGNARAAYRLALQ